MLAYRPFLAAIAFAVMKYVRMLSAASRAEVGLNPISC